MLEAWWEQSHSWNDSVHIAQTSDKVRAVTAARIRFCSSWSCWTGLHLMNHPLELTHVLHLEQFKLKRWWNSSPKKEQWIDTITRQRQRNVNKATVQTPSKAEQSLKDCSKPAAELSLVPTGRWWREFCHPTSTRSWDFSQISGGKNAICSNLRINCPWREALCCCKQPQIHKHQLDATGWDKNPHLAVPKTKLCQLKAPGSCTLGLWFPLQTDPPENITLYFCQYSR